MGVFGGLLGGVAGKAAGAKIGDWFGDRDLGKDIFGGLGSFFGSFLPFKEGGKVIPYSYQGMVNVSKPVSYGLCSGSEKHFRSGGILTGHSLKGGMLFPDMTTQPEIQWYKQEEKLRSIQKPL